MKMTNKNYSLLLFFLIFGVFSCQDPNAPGASFTVTVSGQVLNKSGAPQDSVLLTLNNPFRSTDTTKADGSFNYTFTSEEKNEVTTTLRFHHINNTFIDTTVSVTYSSTKKSIVIGEMRMKGVTTAADSIPPSQPSAPAGAIYFLSSGVPSLAITGSGGIEITNLIFEVRDSVGIPVDSKNTATILFKIKNSATLGAFLNLDSAKTTSSGQVSVQLRSGAKAGLAQVQAVLKSDTTIKSPIVSIPIHGGPPDTAHFSISIGKTNLPGVKAGVSTTIGVLLGDKFGNPVQPGTPVQFTTNGGIVQPFGITSSNGDVSVSLTTGNPIPNNGIATVTAEIPSGLNRTVPNSKNKFRTSALLDKYIAKSNLATKSMGSFSRSVDVLFSGASTINFTDNNFVVPLQLERTFNFTVSDPLGHPLSEGTIIRVIGIGLDSTGVVLSGDIEKILPDTKDPAYTQFSFEIADKRTVNISQSKTLSLAIEVISENGNVKKNITGYLGSAPIDTTGKPVSSRTPAQIAFVGSSTNDIFVSGVGGTETSTLTYEVRDSLGFAIDLMRRVGASFSLQFFPNSFTGGGTSPTIIPNVDSSDNQGRVRVTIVSGTQAGVIQITTSVKVSASKTITSQPVKVTVYAGFADQSHFTMASPAYNFPGLDLAFNTRSITVQVGDKYSNPVIEGTAVYFNSAHGTMTTGGLTSKTGFVSNTLFSANPLPEGKDTLIPDAQILSYYPSTNGFSRVYARTIGKDGQTVIDSLLLLWTGKPIFFNTGANNFTIANGGSAGPFTFTIVDRYGHPMSSGTTISVVASVGKISGNVPRTLGDTFTGGSGVTTFSVFLGDAAPTDTDPAENSTITVTVSHPVYGIFSFTLASGTVD